MNNVNKLNYVCDHLLKPWSKHYTPKEKKVSWATTLILGTFTIGAVQLGALLVKGIVRLSKKGSKTHSSSNKTQSIAKTIIPPSVSSLEKDKAKLTKKIKKNLALEKKLSNERSNLRKKAVKAPVIDEAQVQILVDKRKQLSRLISRTKKLEKKKNNILLQLNLPKESNLHPKAIDFSNLLKKFTKVNEEIMGILEKSDAKKKDRIWQKLKLLSDDFENLGNDFKELGKRTNENRAQVFFQIEIASINLEKAILKLIKIKESIS